MIARCAVQRPRATDVIVRKVVQIADRAVHLRRDPLAVLVGMIQAEDVPELMQRDAAEIHQRRARRRRAAALHGTNSSSTCC